MYFLWLFTLVSWVIMWFADVVLLLFVDCFINSLPVGEGVFHFFFTHWCLLLHQLLLVHGAVQFINVYTMFYTTTSAAKWLFSLCECSAHLSLLSKITQLPLCWRQSIVCEMQVTTGICHQRHFEIIRIHIGPGNDTDYPTLLPHHHLCMSNSVLS